MAENSIVRVVESGPGYIVVEDSSGAVVKRSGVKNWRNNNPGNIVAGSFATKYGAIGKDTSGGRDSQGTTVPTMAVFPTLAAGQAAKKALLFGSGSKYLPLSIWDAIERYAGDPKNHTIDISNYAKSVAKAAGVPTSAKWSSLSSSQQDAVLAAISRFEGFKVGTITPVDPSKYPAGSTPPASTGAASTANSGNALPQTSEPTTSRPPATVEGRETSTSREPAAEIASAPPQVAAPPIMNPLHSYASYTYSISLAMLTIDEYNQIVKEQKYLPKRILISSAGRHTDAKSADDPNQFVRAKYFSEDFYFDDLEITTIVGLNERSRATNAIDLNFTIVEPFGMSLIDRIIKLASSDEVKARNYLEQPYLLQIDFFGINDAGIIIGAIPNQTKRIPIKLLKMDIKASNRGAEYKIEACPYNHSAYNVATLATPAHFEVVAGSVASFFQSTESESFIAEAKNQREGLSKRGITIGPDGLARGSTGEVIPLTAVDQRTANIISADPIYKVKSYGSAYNAYYNDLLKTKKIKVADKIFFKFAPELAEAKFKLGKNLSYQNVPMAEASTELSVRAGKTDAANAGLDYSTAIFSINRGTSIEAVINYVIRNSDYIQNQLTVSADYGSDSNAYFEKKNSTKDLPLKWFKIIPQVVLTEYDSVRKVWGREITYNVIPYEVWNTKIAAAPQGTWKYPVKKYNYFYTGKNTDVLDFNIEFNALYYTAVTAYKRHMATVYGLTDYDDRELNPDKYEGVADPNNAVQPMKEVPMVLDSQARSTGGNYTPTSATAVDVQQSLYVTAKGDMLQGSLHIIGDPQFIKQDDVFYPPYNVIDNLTGKTAVEPKTSDARLIADGSLRMDNKEVYVEVTFKTPIDVNETTGLVDFGAEFQQTSMFSGMYRVLTVKNKFNGGKFEQVLDLVRLPRQTSLDYTRDNQTTERADTPEPNALSQITAAPATTTTNNATVDSTEAVPAPGNNPQTTEETAPTVSADQKDLAKVVATSETQPITANNEPAPAPAPASPSPEKLALKERADAARVERDNAQRAANSVSDSIDQLRTQIERIQATIDRANARAASGAMTRADADALIAQEQTSLTFKTNLLNEKQREFAPLDAANKAAQTAYVNALDAYTRAS